MIIANILAIFCTYLTWKENIWNWPTRILVSILFLIFFSSTYQHEDAIIQILLIGGSFYGITQWTWKKVTASWTQNGEYLELPKIDWLTPDEILHHTMFTLLLSGVLWWVINFTTHSNIAIYQGMFAATSLMAIYLQAKKWLQCWWWWIGASLISLPIYLNKGLPLTAICQVVVVIVSVFGYLEWKRTLPKHELVSV